VVVTVLLDGQAARAEVDSITRRLAAAGIRLVRIDPAALPKRGQVRSLILGGAG
jgi:hypothetical protein